MQQMFVGETMQIRTPSKKFKGYYHKCNKQGNRAYECRTKTLSIHRFQGYIQNCQKYEHKAYECRSNAKWTSNKQTKVQQNVKSYEWDYIIQGTVVTIVKNIEMLL